MLDRVQIPRLRQNDLWPKMGRRQVIVEAENTKPEQ